jgi:hypothetical protein
MSYWERYINMGKGRASKPTICGPIRNGQFTVWVVRGSKGGQLGEFFTREAARKFVQARTNRTRKRFPF